MKNTPKADKKYYFAYGSNCNLEQMAKRCPSATVVGTVTLPNYRLTFNGKSSGVGVASIQRKKGYEVRGVLWEITPACESALDWYEGFPHLYDKHNVTVYSKSGTPIKAMVYIMTPEFNHPALPSNAYYIGILEGFKENGIAPDTLRVALSETYKAIENINGGVAI